MIARRISRRSALRAAGICIALPALDLMQPRGARAQDQRASRFFGFFYPNGTDPRFWNPSPGPLVAGSLPDCLQDLGGFPAEGIWPAGGATASDVTVVTGIDHSGVCVDIHMPSMSLSAHRGTQANYIPPGPTLDQFLAERIQGDSPFRNLSLSATGDLDIGQGHISFRDNGQADNVIRSPRQAYDLLFADSAAGQGQTQQIMARRSSVLDLVLGDAQRLQARAGAADRVRLEQYFDAIRELETQLQSDGGSGCARPNEPVDSGPGTAAQGGRRGNWHSDSKQFIDIAVMAMACDLTRVAVVQYSNSWDVHYGEYSILGGAESLGAWSDHFISHKLDDNDRATDLDGLARPEAQRIADARVVATSRFKVRRFAYLVEALKAISTPTGTLYDETLAMYFSENGDGDSHMRTNMPILLAGGVGGFETGRAVSAQGQPTGALHASIIQRFGVDVGQYGDPAGSAITGL